MRSEAPEICAKLKSALRSDFPLPLLLAQHRNPNIDVHTYIEVLRYQSRVRIEIAAQGDSLQPGTLFVPPPGRHLEVDGSGRMSIVRAGRVNYVCPNADVLLASTAAAFG